MAAWRFASSRSLALRARFKLTIGPTASPFSRRAILTGRPKFATAAAVTASILAGAHIVRVHDVAEMRAVAQVADDILKGRGAD